METMRAHSYQKFKLVYTMKICFAKLTDKPEIVMLKADGLMEYTVLMKLLTPHLSHQDSRDMWTSAMVGVGQALIEGMLP